MLRRLRTKRGQALVETAIMAPVLFFIVLGASDLARLFYYTTAITNAAREGARHGAYYDPTTSPGGNTFDSDSAIFTAVNTEATYLNLTEPCHPNSACTGGLTNCPSYPYSPTLYPSISSSNAGYVFICFNNSTTATTAGVGQPIRVTILYSFKPVTSWAVATVYTAASTEILVEGNN